jgi:uncharacterized protein YqjF (DUF2071 family)
MTIASLADQALRPGWEAIARDTAHRAWLPRARPWVIAQSWRDVLFAHWVVPADALQPLLPAGLTLDTFAGEAWVGLVPFRIPHLAPRGVPYGGGLAFPELNLRTYVAAGDKPGVWFFSLDADCVRAVVGARMTFHLPYYWARMRMTYCDGWVTYDSQRRHPGAAPAAFAGRYRPVGPVYAHAPESLEWWLTERYCLYAADRAGRIYRGEINHPPWPLQAAEAEIEVNTMATGHGFDLSGPPLLHFSPGVDAVTWWPQRVR